MSIRALALAALLLNVNGCTSFALDPSTGTEDTGQPTSDTGEPMRSDAPLARAPTDVLRPAETGLDAETRESGPNKILVDAGSTSDAPVAIQDAPQAQDAGEAGRCTVGATKICSECANAGTQTCGTNGQWGSCSASCL